MTRIYIIRHAEAEGNLYRRIHGQYDSLVTPLGYRQIQALEKRFQDIHLDAVYSSDLFRTQTTAKALYLPKGLPLQLEPGLREISMGDWEDDTWGGAARKYPEQMAYFSGGNTHYTSMGGESFQELRERVVATYYRLAAANDGKTIACVSHGEAIRTAVNAFYGRPLEEMHNMIPSDNTAVSCVEIEGETAKVIFYGDGAHLTPELSTLGKQTWWREPKEKAAIENQNIWYRPWEPAAERELYERYRREAWISVHGDEPCPMEQFYQAAKASSEADAKAVMVAMNGEEIAGLLQMDLERYAEANAGYIPFYYMNQKFRHHGLGIQLIGQAVSTFRPMGRTKLRLRCSPDNDLAQRFYLRNGFTDIAPSADSAVPLRLMEKEIGYPV